VQLLKVWGFEQEGIHGLMESGAFLLLGRDRTVGKVCVDKRFPAGECFLAARQLEIHRKTYGTTDIMTRDRIVCEGIRVVTMVVMTVHIVEETPHMFTQGTIEDQEPVCLRTAYLRGVLEQIRDATVIDAVLEPRCCGEEARQVGFVSALQHAARHVREAVIIEDDETC